MSHSVDRRALLAGLGAAALARPSRALAAQGATPVAGATPTGTGYGAPDLLAEPAWLRERLGEPTLKVVAVAPTDAFAEGHVPGAVALDWPEVDLVETTGPAIEAWQAAVEAKLTERALLPTDTIVVYDDGTLFAARLWWILRQLGQREVRVMNGGLAAWREAGGALEEGLTLPSPAAPYRGTPDPALLATVAEVEAALNDPAVVLLDARSAEEYAAGHIPGAANVDFTRNAAPEPPRRWKPAAELRAMYAAAGVVPERRVIAYCTTGVRAAVAVFTLALLGYPDWANYSGSWREWSADPDRPVTAGDEP